MDSELQVTPALDQAVYQYSVLTADQQLALTDAVLRSGKLSAIGGQHVPDLETQVAGLLGRQGAIATSSATAGIELALRCLPVRPGWGVLVPEVCWASVATAVHHTGGTVHVAPVTADLTPHVEQIEPLLHPSIAAVVLAHVRGRPAPDTTRIAAELAQRGITLIEDCAQAWAVTVDGRPAGSHGTIAVLSTQAWKLVATGEGGIVAADDPDLLRALRSASGDTRILAPDGHPWRGNCRMSELVAASALPQLSALDALTQRLRHLQARVIDRALRVPSVQQVLPALGEAYQSNGSLVGVRLPTRDDARRAADRLYREGIRHWHPSTGDLHLAANWPVTDTRTETSTEVDLARYLDIQIPVLDERHHDEFLDAIASALTGPEES